MNTYIYALRDPNTKEIRYIGKSNNPVSRYSNHLAMSKHDVNRHKKNWINSLKSKGQRPILEILEKVSVSNWEVREKYWIDHARKNKWPITNLSDGGSGYGNGEADNQIYETIKLYLPDNMRHLLENKSQEWLISVGFDMAKVSIPYNKGLFSGRVVGNKGYIAAQNVLIEGLGS